MKIFENYSQYRYDLGGPLATSLITYCSVNFMIYAKGLRWTSLTFCLLVVSSIVRRNMKTKA